MSALAIDALAAAKAAGVALRLKADEGGLVLEVNAEPPPDVLAALRAAKPDLLRILAGREAAKTALNAQPPLDCSPQRWATALRGLQHFIGDGWGDQASLLGWTTAELYRAPPVWARVDLTGAALLIGDRRVVAVTEASIAIETPSGSLLKFRRIGREHMA